MAFNLTLGSEADLKPVLLDRISTWDGSDHGGAVQRWRADGVASWMETMSFVAEHRNLSCRASDAAGRT
jgi:hypothetical protein